MVELTSLVAVPNLTSSLQKRLCAVSVEVQTLSVSVYSTTSHCGIANTNHLPFEQNMGLHT